MKNQESNQCCGVCVFWGAKDETGIKRGCMAPDKQVDGVLPELVGSGDWCKAFERRP